MPRGPKGERRPADVIGRARTVEPRRLFSISSAIVPRPAMATGLTDRLWDLSDIVRLTDEYELERKLKAA
jgi:hypothetical protein